MLGGVWMQRFRIFIILLGLYWLLSPNWIFTLPSYMEGLVPLSLLETGPQNTQKALTCWNIFIVKFSAFCSFVYHQVITICRETWTFVFQTFLLSSFWWWIMPIVKNFLSLSCQKYFYWLFCVLFKIYLEVSLYSASHRHAIVRPTNKTKNRNLITCRFLKKLHLQEGKNDHMEIGSMELATALKHDIV